MNKATCIILAAGDGKRMKSEKPKVLMEVLSQPMLGWVLDSVEQTKIGTIGVIVGNEKQQVLDYLATRGGDYKSFEQNERKGTGHAVMQAESLLAQADNDVLVLCGDAPFIDADTISASYKAHCENKNDVTVITAETDNPFGYGRILRENGGNGGKVLAIVEEKDCTDEQRKITEINSGAYWFRAKALLTALPKLENNNKSGEFYLTDTVKILADKAGAFLSANPKLMMGANDRKGLLALNTTMRNEIIEKHLANGVEFVCTDGIIIEKNVEIGMDTKILPNTILKGNTKIGKNCIIGANSLISDCVIGNNVILDNVHAFNSTIEDGAKAGPFVHLRPNTLLHSGVKIGDFVEVKNSEIGKNTCIAHLTYVGDSDVGKGVNFGCGCVTANYDGVKKYRTKIGDNAFIGCNTNLIAPVEVGDNATTAAGSTITKNVPADSLAVERGKMKVIEHWEKNSMRIKKA